MKIVIKNCPAFNNDNYAECECNNLPHIQCFDNNDCVIKQIVGLCKDVKEKDPIVVERDKQTGEIISICGWTENPIYDFVQKILQVLEIEEIHE